MENNENFVVEQTTENVEQTTEETPKYTETEFNAKLDEVLGKKLARKEAKIRKEYDRKYGQLEEVLKAGTGKDNVEEMTDTFRQFYEKKGIQIRKKPDYTDEDIRVLAERDANEFIQAGYEDVVEEVDRLTGIGFENMTAREKATFKVLAEHRQYTEQSNELTQMGVTEDVFNSKEFKDFKKKFASNTPITEVFDIYRKTQPKKEIKTMGSMKNAESGDNGVKDFYSVEEARRFTKEDFDKNPALFEAVQKSMTKWK